MKSVLLTLTTASLMMFAAESSLACSMSPKGDSQLRVKALHETLGSDEILVGLKAIGHETYELEVKSYTSDEHIVRLYKVENTSPMCPVYKTTLID